MLRDWAAGVMSGCAGAAACTAAASDPCATPKAGFAWPSRGEYVCNAGAAVQAALAASQAAWTAAAFAGDSTSYISMWRV